MEQLSSIFELLEQKEIPSEVSNIEVYPNSYETYQGVTLLMVKMEQQKYILATGKGQLYEDLAGKEIQEERKVCSLVHENRLVLNNYFDYTIPVAFGTNTATIGLGDRLGMASPGHIETVKNKNIKPVLAQQSIRELTLTQRTMEDVLDAACFAVFQEGYKEGFGADGDHLKRETDIRAALEKGMSMLTLDCSDYIHTDIEAASESVIRNEYEQLPKEEKEIYNERYLNNTFDVKGLSITFDEKSLMRNVLLYRNAISYMVHVYNQYIREGTRSIDFEISIDETEAITTPQAHFFVAQELYQQGVALTSLAPKFCGEFQKGIDYIGDLEQFEKELDEHAMISDYFDYKLSVHSGSDKFKIFPIVSKYTKGRFHLKTAGTNWLEAIRVIADKNPDLYRRMHQYAWNHFEEARQYYQITPDLESITPLNGVSDEELNHYMDRDPSRQMFHVTFGILLTAKDENGNHLFKNEFFDTLTQNDDAYKNALVQHIGNHLNYLGFS